jgi:hypothetical protein
MPFSYGYHFCHKYNTNCIQASLDPKKATQKAAVQELMATRLQLDNEIERAQRALAKPAPKKTK